MGYFPNGFEGDAYELKYCATCLHNSNCAVWDAHMLYNYDECNNEKSILHVLIPRTKNHLWNEKCKMHISASQASDALSKSDKKT